jgi:hypothetical protein
MALSKITADSITANTITSAALANTGVTSGVYGGAAAIPVITVDSVGRITSASNAALGVSNTANNLAGGSAGTIPYQTGSGSTAMLSTGTAGQVLTSNGTNAPSWSTPVSSLYTPESLIFTGPAGFFGGGSIYVLQNPSANLGTLKLAGVPSQDVGSITGISSNRLSYLTAAYSIKRDFYNNQLISRFRGTLDQGSGNQPISGVARSKDGNDWTTISLGVSSGNPIGFDAAVNKYTGRNVVVTTGVSDGNIYSNPASQTFNLSSLNGASTITALNSVTGGSATQAYYVNFIDSGTQSTSYFLIYAIDTVTSYVLYSLDGISWTATTITTSKYFYNANFIGNNTEVMAGIYGAGGTSGVARSLYNGTSWDTYNFGDSTHGTASNFYPSGLTHNGTYWLSVLNNSGGTTWLTTKTMGSGTTWTFISGFPTTYGQPTSVAYSSTEGKWYVLAGGNNNRLFLYSSSQSDPNTSSWTLVQTSISNTNGYLAFNTNINNIMALASSTLNPTTWLPA